MTIFAVMAPEPQPALESAIAKSYPDKSYRLAPTQWLLADKATTKDVCTKLNIVKDGNRAIVVAVSSYFGIAPVDVWEWLKVKWDSPSNG